MAIHGSFNPDKHKQYVSNAIRMAFYSYFHKDRSPDKCILQKYARSAFKGLKNGWPPGTVGA